jgi:hypothetical protein
MSYFWRKLVQLRHFKPYLWRTGIKFISSQTNNFTDSGFTLNPEQPRQHLRPSHDIAGIFTHFYEYGFIIVLYDLQK